MKHKQNIENAALAGPGLPLKASDIVRINRTRQTVTYRHSWASADGPVWYAVSAAARAAALKLATQRQATIEIYLRNGVLSDVVYPE